MQITNSFRNSGTSPSSLNRIYSAPITGNVSGGHWTLAYAPNNDEGAATGPFVTLATGSTPVTNGVLGTLDPSGLLNGVYTIRLTSTDDNGQTSKAAVNVIVSRNRKLSFFTISFNDLSVPMPGLPIQIVRTYDSRNNVNQGDFGFGWTLSIANVRLQKNRTFSNFWQETVEQSGLLPRYCVQSDNNKYVTITFPDGRCNFSKGEAKMGGHPWYYFVRYQPDINQALQELREREFQAGRYSPAIMFPEFPATTKSASPGPKHPSIQGALKAAGADGTRSILDMQRVAERRGYGLITPLSHGQLMRLYGTTQPTREMIEEKMYGDIERGQGIYIVAYRMGKPSEIFFAGYSYD